MAKNNQTLNTDIPVINEGTFELGHAYGHLTLPQVRANNAESITEAITWVLADLTADIESGAMDRVFEPGAIDASFVYGAAVYAVKAFGRQDTEGAQNV